MVLSVFLVKSDAKTPSGNKVL